jgi:lysophospholipase L1-like esterase
MKIFPVNFTGPFLLVLAFGISAVDHGVAADAPAITNGTTVKPHDFARWEKEIAAYEQKDKTNPPPKDPLLFTGASMITKWTTLAEDFPGQPVMNRGVGGSEVKDITHFADRIVFPYAPRMIFFRSGGNDIHYGESFEDVFADYKEFVTTVHAKLPATEIIFIALSPSIARWEQHDKEMALNALIKDFSKQTPHLGYIDDYDIPLGADGKPRPEIFVSDGQHFNAAGYKMLAERVRPYLPK